MTDRELQRLRREDLLQILIGQQKQIQDAAHGYVVKDDIETGYGNIIPLWQFGLTY